MAEKRFIKRFTKREDQQYEEQILQVNRVAKKRKGGERIGFSVLVAVGDKQGKVGVALGKAPAVVEAIRKASKKAKKSLVKVHLDGGTIPHAVKVKYGAGRIILKPAPAGRGLVAGSSVRVILRLAGVKDVSAKILGTRNKITNAYATIKALEELKAPRPQRAKDKKADRSQEAHDAGKTNSN